MTERDGLNSADRPVFTVEPWCVREPELRLDRLAQTESVFALSNGHVGMRGNLDEGEPHGLPGTYLNSFYEQRPLPHAETAYGYPESGQTVINVTNGKVIRLLVDDEPLDLRYGRVLHHERILDMRAGTLTRHVEWTSPVDKTIKVTSVRIVSLTQRAVAAVCYEVEPVDQAVRVVAQSELVANEALPGGGKDPRSSAILESPSSARSTSPTAPRSCCCTGRGRAACGWRRACRTTSRARSRWRSTPRAPTTSAG